MARKVKRSASKKGKSIKAEEVPDKDNEEPADVSEEQESDKSKTSEENGDENKGEEESEEPTTPKGKRKPSEKSKNGVETEESSSLGENEKKGARKRGKASKSSSRKTESETVPSKRSKREVKKPELFSPIEASGKEWEVADIVQKRERQGRTEYLVRWKGYKLSDATWEPESNLQNCRKLLDKYNNK